MTTIIGLFLLADKVFFGASFSWWWVVGFLTPGVLFDGAMTYIWWAERREARR